MDWIERYFGLAPDNGDGTVELMIVAAAVVAAAVVVVWAVPRWRAGTLRFVARLSDRERPQ